MILELGCGLKPRKGAINHDLRKHSHYVDITHDLNVAPWPWPDNEFSEVFAIDLIEHLDNFIAFFDECWRILAPHGRIHVQVPQYDSINVHIDPTHKRGYHPASFEYLDPETGRGAGKGRIYTDKGWEIINVKDDGGNITAVLEVRK